MGAFSKFLSVGLASLLALPPGRAESRMLVRIKDVTRVKGHEEYTLTGIGLVTGLAGTGDSDRIFTQRVLANALQNFNIIVKESDLKAQNIAVVSVTATIRKTANKGDMVPATVAAVGDASSLLGGELLLTPLFGIDGEPWAVAQGPVTIGGFSFGGSVGQAGGAVVGAETVQKNHPTAGMLNNGAKLLKDVFCDLSNADIITLILREPDYTSAVKIAEAVNRAYFGTAVPVDDSAVKVRVPIDYREEGRVSVFIHELQQLYFKPDRTAKVVFNERTGTIVIGGDVKISAAAVAHGNISVSIKNTAEVSQPSPFLQLDNVGGPPQNAIRTQGVINQDVDVQEHKVPVFDIPDTSTVSDLVKVLNTLGVTPRDIMIIFQCLRASGALHAELEAI